MSSPRPSILWHREPLPLNHTPGNSTLSLQTDTCTINIQIFVPILPIHSCSNQNLSYSMEIFLFITNCQVVFFLSRWGTHSCHFDIVLKKRADSLFSAHAGCTLRQTHVVAVVAGDISGPSDCTGLPWLSPQDCENICHGGCHFPLWSERQVKVLPASLMTWYTWVPPTTVLINRQMEQEPQQIEQRFARIGPARLFR